MICEQQSSTKSYYTENVENKIILKKFWEWKRINHKQSARWQHLSQFKASAFLFEIFLLGVKKHSSSYLRVVSPSSGW